MDWHYFDPCKPQQNDFIDSFSGRPRVGLLNEEFILTLDDARRKRAFGRYDYDHVKSHSSFGNKQLQKPVERLNNLRVPKKTGLSKSKSMEFKTAVYHHE